MNKASKTIASSLAGTDFKTVFIAGEAYTIYPPTIKIMARGFDHWSEIDFDENDNTVIGAISQINGNMKPLVKGLSIFVTGDVHGHILKAYKLERKWMKGTPSAKHDEICRAISAVLELIPAEVFFSTVRSLKSALKIMATEK